MKYYLHDSTSFNDEKITELYLEFGYEGLGLFYTILEKLALQEKPIKTKILKHQLNVGKKLEKCWDFMEKIELISSINGETFNEQLLNFSKKYQVNKEKNADKVAEWRKSKKSNENVTGYEPDCNATKVNKVKSIKIKESKHFDFFWEAFNKKIDRAKCENVWSKLTEEEVQKIVATVDQYVLANPEIKFRKNPLTYLNGKCFNDEIVFYPKPQNNGNFNNEQKLGTSAARMEAARNF
jgi:hypothetical protein